jgi:hypothetical protein
MNFSEEGDKLEYSTQLSCPIKKSVVSILRLEVNVSYYNFQISLI